jgi:putative SOS response-associated peptidase YedK
MRCSRTFITGCQSSFNQTIYDLWLDPGTTDPAKVSDLLKPFDPRLMRVYAVSSTVNSVKNEGPECAENHVR